MPLSFGIAAFFMREIEPVLVIWAVYRCLALFVLCEQGSLKFNNNKNTHYAPTDLCIGVPYDGCFDLLGSLFCSGDGCHGSRGISYG